MERLEHLVGGEHGIVSVIEREIDVDPDTAMERIRRGRTHTELFEKRSRLARVREKYLEAFERLQDEETVIRIDGSRSQEEVAEEIWEKVSGILR